MQSIVIAELKYQKILNKFINSTVTNILDIVYIHHGIYMYTYG